MRFNSLAGVLAATAVLAAGTASAATVQYSATIDLDPTMLSPLGLEAMLPGGPISLGVGDHLEGTIDFANQGRITVFNNGSNGLETFLLLFNPDAGKAVGSTGFFQFLGVQGDYTGPSIVGTSTVNGALAINSVANFTNTSFSFTGISYGLVYVDNRLDSTPLTTHVTPGELFIPKTAVTFSENVPTTPTTPVPEPATWAMMILGFGLVGGAARRRMAPRAA